MSYQPKNDDIEKELNIIRCSKCGRYNFNGYVKKYGKCRACKNVLDEKADFKYTMIRKMHLFKRNQVGYLYKRDAYKEN